MTKMLNRMIMVLLLMLTTPKGRAYRIHSSSKEMPLIGRNPRSLEMKLPDSARNKNRMVSFLRKSLIVASFFPLIANANPQPVVRTMDSAVVKLEQSQDRESTLQAMDELFAAAETKSSIVKAKFKYRIVNSLKEKKIQLNDKWDVALATASEEVRRRIDPYHSVELSGYLKIAPFVGGAAYLMALLVQTNFPDLFIIAYPTAVGVFLTPIIFKIITG